MPATIAGRQAAEPAGPTAWLHADAELVIAQANRLARLRVPPRWVEDVVAETLVILCDEVRCGAVHRPTAAWMHKVIRSALRRFARHELVQRNLGHDELQEVPHDVRAGSAWLLDAGPPLLLLRGQRQRWFVEQIVAGATIPSMAETLNWPEKEVRRQTDRLTAQLLERAKNPPATSTA